MTPPLAHAHTPTFIAFDVTMASVPSLLYPQKRAVCAFPAGATSELDYNVVLQVFVPLALMHATRTRRAAYTCAVPTEGIARQAPLLPRRCQQRVSSCTMPKPWPSKARYVCACDCVAISAVCAMRSDQLHLCRLQLPGHGGRVTDFIFVDDKPGVMMSSSLDGHIRVWDLRTSPACCDVCVSNLWH